MSNVTQVAKDYKELEEENMSKIDIFVFLCNKYDSTLATLMFSLEYQVEEYGLAWDWDTIYKNNDVYNYLDKKIKDKKIKDKTLKAIILSNAKIVAQGTPNELVNNESAHKHYFGNKFRYK